MQLRQVVDLRSALSQLERSLVLHDPLRHRGRVGITDRDDLNQIVVGLFNCAITTFRRVSVVRRQEVTDDLLQELELHAKRCMDAGLDSRHSLELPLKDSQRGAHRSLGTHVRDLQVCDSRKPSTVFRNLLQQSGQNLARLLVRKRHDVVTHTS